MRTPALAPVEVVLRDLGIKEPEGIDLEIIAWHLGATIKYARLGSCEACIVGNSCNAVICVDERKSVERQRFSIGHELGHWHHHRGKHLICRADDIARGSERRLERQADEYAGDLILPNPILAACLGDYGKMVNLTMLRELRNRFQASLTSIAIGITKTNRFPLAVVCSRGDGRVWAARSQCLSKFWRLRTDLDPESLAARMLENPLEKESSYASLIGADAWFVNDDADRYDIKEQSYRSSPDEVVTLITVLSDRMLD